ncbi:unnamed protein product [Paramecium pentaurelia]|uniref:Carboxypeptidase Q n=1 Tax=Paramecium pentaurelia TaxID=43138 RepID=A0A8S1W9T3_9CILI|nr:unnamed protein product [Paramecium pentaurelia]
MKFIILLVFTFCVNALMLRSVKDKITEGVIQQIREQIKNPQSQYYHSAYNRLAYYVDTFGPRLWGSENMADAVDALYKDIEKMGFDRVWKENLGEITSWMRGEESVTLFEPRQIPQKLNMIGLGWTPAGVVKGEVEVVHSFEELKEKDVKGKIVCFNFEWNGYGSAIAFRFAGPVLAEKAGAIGTMIRSVASVSIASPHTGMTDYENIKYPAVAITVEDADMLDRMKKRGQKVVVEIKTGGQQYKTTSDNVFAEIKGYKYPDEILLMGGHWDSWDVGSQTGANDDGGGVIVCLEALRILNSLGIKPKRTIRFIAWSGEEMGQNNNGAFHYARNHGKDNHIIAFESDLGSTKPYGFGITAGQQFTQLVTYLAQEYLTGIGAERIYPNDGESVDSGILADFTGTPMLNNRIADNENHDFYFTYHHTAGDSMWMMNPEDMDDNVVAIASIMYLIADYDGPIPKD